MLIEFYGKECSHCIHMAPLVEQLEKEENREVTKYEVWHNEENAEKLEMYDKDLCGGVPFFYNTDTDKHICGQVSYEKLKKWATVK